jgi:hypothetical protein
MATLRAFAWTSIVVAAAASAPAAGHSTTALDGTYAGVSATANGGFNTCVVGSGRPRQLIITNGTAVWHGGRSGAISSKVTLPPKRIFTCEVNAQILCTQKLTLPEK